MLRLIVLLLFIANLAFYGWTQGWLDAWLPHGPAHEGPQRLARQVHPERVRIVPLSAAASGEATASDGAASGEPSAAASPDASGAAPASAPSGAALSPGASGNASEDASGGADAGARAAALPSAAPGVCVQAGPYNTAERSQVEARLRAALASAVWTVETVERPGAWLLYMGPYPDTDLMARKKDELHKLGIAFQDQRSPPTLAPGLALGRFDERRDADAALLRLTERGVRSARVITLRAPQPGYVLRFARADAALRAGLAELGAAAFLNRPPQPCSAADGAAAR